MQNAYKLALNSLTFILHNVRLQVLVLRFKSNNKTVFILHNVRLQNKKIQKSIFKRYYLYYTM